MLAVLVAPPVVFTPEAFGAIRKGTDVRLYMALDMLPIESMSAAWRVARGHSAYLSSHGLEKPFPHPGSEQMCLFLLTPFWEVERVLPLASASLGF